VSTLEECAPWDDLRGLRVSANEVRSSGFSLYGRRATWRLRSKPGTN